MTQKELNDYLTRSLTLEDTGLQRVLDDHTECALFKRFLDEERSSEHILFWLEAELFRTIDVEPNELHRRAQQIFQKYFVSNSKYEINVNSSIMGNITRKMEKIEQLRKLKEAEGSEKKRVRIAKHSESSSMKSESGLEGSTPSSLGTSPISSSFGTSFIPSIKDNLVELALDPDDKDEALLDNNLFVPAQISIFNLLEMDSLPRFLNSEIYLNYKDGKRDKDRIDENLMFLTVKIHNEELLSSSSKSNSSSSSKGISSNSLFGNSDTFLANDLVTWIMQTLFISDRPGALKLAQLLAEKGIIVCVQNITQGGASNSGGSLPGLGISTASSASSSIGTIGPSGGGVSKQIGTIFPFEDDQTVWKVNKYSGQTIKKKRNVEEILEIMPFRTCDRDSFHRITDFTNYLLENLPILTKIVSSSWAINRSDRDDLANFLVRIAYDSMYGVVPMIRAFLQQNFSKKDLGSLKYGEQSIVNKVMNSYFGLIGRDYIRAVLTPLFSKQEFEKVLSFDLRSENEDRTVNQMEFLRVLKLVVEQLFSVSTLEKIPIDIREMASILGEYSLANSDDRFISIVGGFLFRTINRAIIRPDLFDVVRSPYIPLPRVKENLFLITRCIENLVTGSKFGIKSYSFMIFTNSYLTEKRQGINDFLKTFTTMPRVARRPSLVEDEVFINFADYANLILIMDRNMDKLVALLKQDASDSLIMGGHKQDNSFDITKRMINKFFELLGDSYSLIKKGSDSGKFKLYYCPVFPNCKAVINFCLSNNIYFEPHKIDFLYGDLKEDPILSDGERSVSGCVPILKYLTEKFCVSGEWFYHSTTLQRIISSMSIATLLTSPTSSQLSIQDIRSPASSRGSVPISHPIWHQSLELVDDVGKCREVVLQFLDWQEMFIKEPINQIFWKETFPRYIGEFYLSSSSSLSSSQDGESNEGTTYPMISPKERKDRLISDANYQILSDSLTSLDIFLGKAREKRRIYLVAKDRLSVADIVLIEQISFISLFNNDALEAYPNIKRWFRTVKKCFHFWDDVNVDFQYFSQCTHVLSQNIDVPCVNHSIGFVKASPKYLYDKLLPYTIKQSNSSTITATSPKNVGTVGRSGTKLLGTSVDQIEISEIEQVIPEKIVSLNYRSEHIQQGHFSALGFQIHGISASDTTPVTKVEFKLVNAPPNKIKNINEDWSKIWKQMNGITLSDYRTNLYFQLSVDLVWETLLTSKKLSSLTKTICSIIPKAGNQFSLFDGTVTGVNTALYPNELILQRWRSIDWPDEYYSTVKYKIEPFIMNGAEAGTSIEFSQNNIPTEKMKDVKNKHKNLWKKLKAEIVGTVTQDVYFQEMNPTQVYELFIKTESGTSTSLQLIKLANDVSYPTYELVRVYRGNDWPMGHQSRVTINLYQVGDRDVRNKKITKLVLCHENVPKSKVKSVAELWEKHFWKKMKGIITTEYQSSLFFNFTKPSEVYESFLNFSRYTTKKCAISDEIGGTFTLYDDLIHGKNVRLVKNHLIVQKWRFSDWPEDHYGTVRVVLKRINQTRENEDEQVDKEDQNITTKMIFSFDGIPIGKPYTNVINFWQKHWKSFRGPKGEIGAGVTSKLKKKS